MAGAVLSRPYYWGPPAYAYAPPPVYYSYAPPPVVYSTPVYSAPVYSAPVYSAPPVYVERQVLPPPAPQVSATMPVEDRLRRLRSMCDQGLLTESECHAKREDILKQL